MEEIKRIKLFAGCDDAYNKMRTFAVKGLRNRVIEHLENNGSIESVSATAQQLGVTRPSLSRILSDMLNEGLLIKDGKFYKLL